jgi:tripartite-type tricarboxylate transporter receptor subunit TctC
MSHSPPRFHAVLIGLTIATLGIATAARAADYYAGKTIELIVGAAPGGGYDIYARAVARHLSRHIPGNPTIVVKNMPGAGSAMAGYHIGRVAPSDGVSIGAVMPGAIVGPLLDDEPQTLFDPTKVIYLGTANAGSGVCATLISSKSKTFEDALTQKTVMGAVAPGNLVHDIAYLVKRTTGAQFEIVAGYKGTLEAALAIERGELDGMCGWNWSSVKSQKPDWIRDGKLNLLAQIGPEPNPELTKLGVPPIWNYIKNDDARKVAEMIVGQQAYERPYITALGTPVELVNTLRAAFDATMADPQFLADAERLRIDISPLSGSTVQELVQKFYATPKDVAERARQAIRP